MRSAQRSALSRMVKVAVKWAKETYSVDVDLAEPGLVFKHQLFSLTGVPPERQKIMVKGGMLKDDADVAKLGLKEGQKLMMMGSADKARRQSAAEPGLRCLVTPIFNLPGVSTASQPAAKFARKLAHAAAALLLAFSSVARCSGIWSLCLARKPPRAGSCVRSQLVANVAPGARSCRRRPPRRRCFWRTCPRRSRT